MKAPFKPSTRLIIAGCLALAPVAAAASLADAPTLVKSNSPVPWCCVARSQVSEKPLLPATPSTRAPQVLAPGRRYRRGRLHGDRRRARQSGPIDVCFHCGGQAAELLDLPVGDARHLFCSKACHLACVDYHAAGLGHLYALSGPQARRLDRTEAEAYGEAAFAGAFVQERDGVCEAYLLIEGMHCGSCVWILERAFARVPGVIESRVHLTSGRARVRWAAGKTDLKALMEAVARSGYAARPYDPGVAEAPMRAAHRFWLSRLAIAGFGAVATMFLAEPLYWNYQHVTGQDQAMWQMLRYLGMVMATATSVFTAAPFLRGALAGIQRRQLGMDVLIALGVIATYAASVWGFLTHGAVYFDSLTMFLFLIVLGRFAESAVKNKVYAAMEHLLGAQAKVARVVRDGAVALVPAATLVAGELLELRPGDQMPADGVIESGVTSVDESMLTGESRPVAKAPGDAVTGGTLNLEGTCRVRVTRAGADTTFAHLERLVKEADPAKTRIQRLADAAGHWGTLVVAATAAATMAGWGMVDPSRALSAAVAVLIVTCPCALGLATPAALTLAVSRALKLGLLFKRPEALEDLLGVERVVFDKTGTLTTGEPTVTGLVGEAAEVLPLAAALEAGSEHPIARAVLAHAASQGVRVSTPPADFAAVPGQGVKATVGGKRALAGRGAWLEAEGLVLPAEWTATVAGWMSRGYTVLWVAQSERVLGAIALGDRLRPDAARTVRALKAAGIGVTLLSGDNHGAAEAIAKSLGIEDVVAEVLPADKLEVIRALQAKGRVAMVGDGLNDAPALAAADVGIAIARGADLSVVAADVVILGERLGAITDAFALARRAFGVIQGNFWISGAYNALVIPLAVFGFVTPLLAAILMPLSSMAVLVNALRLRR